jgi:hypothetical protein
VALLCCCYVANGGLTDIGPVPCVCLCLCVCCVAVVLRLCCGWLIDSNAHIARFLKSEKARNEAFAWYRKFEVQRDRDRRDDSATAFTMAVRRLQDAECALAAEKAAAAVARAQVTALEAARDTLRAAWTELQSKWTAIQSFEALRLANDRAIRLMIRTNRRSRDRFAGAQQRIARYLRENAIPNNERISACAQAMRSAVAREWRAIAQDRIPLAIPFASPMASADHPTAYVFSRRHSLLRSAVSAALCLLRCVCSVCVGG